MNNKDRNFGLLVGGMLVLLSLVHWKSHSVVYDSLLIIGVLLLLAAIFFPPTLGTLRQLWDRIGHVLGIINTYILLTLFFFFVLTPVSLIKRALSVAKRSQPNTQNSYWQQATTENNFTNQF